MSLIFLEARKGILRRVEMELEEADEIVCDLRNPLLVDGCSVTALMGGAR